MAQGPRAVPCHRFHATRPNMDSSRRHAPAAPCQMNHTAAARVNQSRKSKLETERTIGVRCQLQRSLGGRAIPATRQVSGPRYPTHSAPERAPHKFAAFPPACFEVLIGDRPKERELLAFEVPTHLPLAAAATEDARHFGGHLRETPGPGRISTRVPRRECVAHDAVRVPVCGEQPLKGRQHRRRGGCLSKLRGEKVLVPAHTREYSRSSAATISRKRELWSKPNAVGM